MPKDKLKRAPSQYPTLPFHILRAAQLVSSLIVTPIMGFFIWNLSHDHWAVPKTFAILLTASLLTIVSLAATFFLHYCFGLNPRVNAIINATLFVLWMVGVSLLTWWSRNTLGHKCDVKNWQEDRGIMVCRVYKALFAFTLTGCAATLMALLLDIYVFKKTTARGIYNPMQNLDRKTNPVAAPEVDSPRNSGGPFDDPQAYGSSRSARAPRAGYAVPEEQFDEDTEYNGGQERRALVA